MRNVLAIAQKEIKAYFDSPIAYIFIGFFALLFGYFFVALLSAFTSQSMQMMLQGGGSMNVNQQLQIPRLPVSGEREIRRVEGKVAVLDQLHAGKGVGAPLAKRANRRLGGRIFGGGAGEQEAEEHGSDR